jgi:hypothetical protein
VSELRREPISIRTCVYVVKPAVIRLEDDKQIIDSLTLPKTAIPLVTRNFRELSYQKALASSSSYFPPREAIKPPHHIAGFGERRHCSPRLGTERRFELHTVAENLWREKEISSFLLAFPPEPVICHLHRSDRRKEISFFFLHFVSFSDKNSSHSLS